MNVFFTFIPSDGLNDKFKQIERIIDKIEKLRLVEKTGKFAFFIIVLVWWDIGCILTGVINKCGIPFYHGDVAGSVSQHDTLKCFKEQETNTDSIWNVLPFFSYCSK